MNLPIDPELWFTLYVLAQQGAVHRSITITTSDLGELLNISQQTASRRISACVEKEYIERIHSANGMQVKITQQGQLVLKNVLKGLELAFTETERKVIINGKVVQGIGEGAYYVEIYAPHFQKVLGFRPYPGTLNVQVQDNESKMAVKKMRQGPPLIVKGFSHKGRTFGDVICYRVKINSKIDAAVVVAQRTHHSENILEIIAPVNLRDELGLNDGDQITLTVIPPHLAE